MYIGQYCHSTDAKGRVIMPSRFREQLGESFVVTKGYEGCLTVYSAAEWETFTARLLAMPDHNADARRLVRMFSSGAVSCETDKQGRILLPQHLREYAGIEKEVMVIGALSRVEIWDTEKWARYNDDEDAMTLEEAAARLSGAGI
ncbi:MAG: division/cell wall cluster transcriptional repressor MraZ [Clostridia bacterium]|nr:division/cell wall cluster transcriptional repressor MraZ [Clostridia bacterium]